MLLDVFQLCIGTVDWLIFIDTINLYIRIFLKEKDCCNNNLKVFKSNNCFLLASYSQELNPIEGVWKLLKE